MFNTPSFSTFVASLLFCLGIGVLAGVGSQARAAENGENTPVVRQPIVGGTPFPNLYHYEDPSTRTEVWSISPPRTADSDMDAPPPPIYVSPEINFSWPGDVHRPQPRPSAKVRP